jgi:GTP-binding protein
LTGTRRSIVTAIAGTTRDVITHPVTWGAHRFDLTDTGGLFGASEDPLHELVKIQGARALKSADLIVIVVDGREGLIPGDQDIAQAARDANVPLIMAVNKTDDRRSRAGALELTRLGIDTVVEISAEHGEGVGDLLEEIVKKLGDQGSGIGDQGEDEPPPQPPNETAIAIVGRPNAGKSSLVNRLLREERMIVSEVPGTTRDSVDSMLQWHKRTLRIVDTAGMRKPGKVGKSQVESLSVLLAKRAIERADVVVLVIDATVGPTDQDGAIAGAAKEAGKGIIVAANKWDLMKDQGEDTAKNWDENLRYQLKFLDYAPILHISAATGERTPKLLETAASPPVTSSKRNVRIKYASQVSVAPPTIVLFANTETKFHFSYERFIENRLRESYDFFGNPIRIQVRGRRDDPKKEKRLTAIQRAPDKRKPVKKGPGSKPTRADRARAARPAKRTTKKSHRKP